MRPTDEELTLAAEWLDVNEGNGQEGDSCHRVAEWLRDEVRARMIRREARSAGVPVARVRERLEAAP